MFCVTTWRGGVYNPSCSSPPGGGLGVLNSLSGSSHVHLYTNSEATVIKNFECDESSAPVCLLLFYYYQVKVSQKDTSCNLEMYSLISGAEKKV